MWTDSIVIGRFISVSEVIFYAIPASLLDYLEKFIWAMIAVLIPIISSREAVGDNSNKRLYIVGTKYSLILSFPIIFVLFTVGDDFIAMWIGEEYGLRSMWVLKILIIGYVLSFSQLIAHGILKGVSRHKVLAYILIVEAFVNLVLSIILAKPFGIEGVALGTTLPLIVVNLIIIPLYTCKVLNIEFSSYIWKSYSGPLLLLLILAIIYSIYPIHVSNYSQLVLFASFVLSVFSILSLSFIVEVDHRGWLLAGIRSKLL